MEIDCTILITVVTVLFIFNPAQSQECLTGARVGSAQIEYRNGVDDTPGRAYINTGSAYQFNCIGYITEFNFHCHKDGDVTFQIWRPLSGDEYTLVEELPHTVTGCKAGDITLFADTYTGANVTLQDNLAQLGPQLINEVSSVEVTGFQTWRLFNGVDYRGVFVDIITPGQTNNLGAVGNNAIESVARLGEPRSIQHDGVPVEPGDTLAIVQDGGQVVYTEYASGSSACCLFHYTDISVHTPGGTGTFPSSNAVRREYSLSMTLEPSNTPVFVNLDHEITICEDTEIGTDVFEVHVMDLDVEYGSETLSFSLNDNFFEIDADTGVIRTKASLDFETRTTHILTVEVTDGVHNSITATLTISICDVYEEHTVTNLPNEIILDIKQKDICDTSVFSVAASAAPGQPTAFSFNMVSLTPPDGSFALDSVTGEVKCADQTQLVDKLNPEYVMEISVVDPVGINIVGPLDLTIRLININSPPVFTNMPGIARVPEDKTGGSIFHMNVNDTDDDFYNFTLTGVTPPDMADIFRYNWENGTVTVVKPDFDYETGLREFKLRFTTNDHLHTSQEEELTVYITDVNEPPICWPVDYHVSIPEHTPSKTRLPIYLNASDPDFNDFVEFSLDPGIMTQYFTVIGHYVYTAEPVDLGTNVDQTYDLIVHALDKQGLSCEAHVYVEVTQVNDPHYIDNLPEVVFVDAQSAVEDDIVFTVIVDPNDIEPEDALTYSWTYDEPDGAFRLDPLTGEITVTRNMSLHTREFYNFSVEVTDRYGNVAGPKELLIYVTNIRQAPVITNLPMTISIEETVTNARNLLQIDVYDPDNNAIKQYSIEAAYPADQTKFTLNSNTGIVSSIDNPEFNFEEQNTYILTITAQDSVHTSQPKNLTITILDVNEPPEAMTLKYTGRVYEEESAGKVIQLGPRGLDAYDPDFNDSVTYWLQDSKYSDFFTLLGDQLAVDRRIDRESGISGTVELEVATTDRHGLQGPVLEIILSVIDINDVEPVFEHDHYKGEVSEDTYGGTYVLTVQASDGDADSPNHDFEYYIHDTYELFEEGQTFFMVDKNTGDIRVKHQIDYDRFPVVDFEVYAIDKGSYPGQLTGTTLVTITVGDVNNGRPEFAEDFISLEVASNEDAGHLLATLNATDVDSAVTSNLTYYFMKYDSHFFLGRESGEVSLRREVEDDTKYVLYALARDNGIPREEVSNVAILRIDSFTPAAQLVNIELAIPLHEYEDIADRFLASLRKVIKPLHPKIHHVYGQQDFTKRRKLLASTDNTKTIVTVYALEDLDAYELSHLTEKKNFAGRNKLLSDLRRDISGTPSKDLQTPEFADYFVTRVSPTHPIWIIDTIGGITVLTLLALGVLGTIIGIIVCCCRRSPACGYHPCDRIKQVLCPCFTTKTVVTPTRIKSRPPTSDSTTSKLDTTQETVIQAQTSPLPYDDGVYEFRLRYAKSSDYQHSEKNQWRQELNKRFVESAASHRPENGRMDTPPNRNPSPKTENSVHNSRTPSPRESGYIRNREKPPSATRRTSFPNQKESTKIEKLQERSKSADATFRTESSVIPLGPRLQMVKGD